MPPRPPRSPTRTSSPARRAPGDAARARLALQDPSIESWAAGEVAELALAVEREALAADARVAGVETAVYADSADRVAIASSAGIAGEYEASSCYAYAQVLARGDGGTETGLGFDLARGPGRSTRPRSAARAPSGRRR